MAETVHDCSLSVELKFLEAEYERSKLRVHQDTLICQNSMLEIDLLCKNEELRNKARSNAELVQRGTELQLHVRSLEEEARAAKDLLKCAEQALENERNQSETKEKEFRRKCEADLKRKLDKEVRELDGVRPDLLREVQQWKEKFSGTRTQVEQLKRELCQKNRKLKDKATQIEVSESEARLIQKRADRAQVCDAAEQLGESSSLSSKQLEEPSSPCDTEEQRGKALPESIKDEEDDKTRKTRYKKRKVRGKKMKASQTEEHAEGVKEVQHSGYEAPSDTNVRQEKERVTQEQKAEEEKINLLKGTSQGAEVQTQEREQVLGDMDNEGEESEEGKKEDTADVSETGERESDVITGKNLSESEKITGSIAEGVKALKRTGKKPQECESKKNRKKRRKAKKDNKPGKCSTETKTLGEREPEERTPCNSSEASEIIVEEAEHLEETKEQGAKEQNCDEAGKEESVGEELGKVTGEDEQEKPDHVKETEEIEGKTTTKKVIQRQRKGKKGISHQAKERELQVSQEKAVNAKRQQRKAPRKQKSDEVEESAEKEDKENSDKSDDYSEEDKKAQSRHLRKEVREKQDEKTEEMKGISKTTKVEQVEQHLQKSAAEVDEGAGETEKLQKPKTRRLQRETNNKFKEDEEEKKIAGNSSRKRRAVPEEAPGDIINSNPQQCVTNSHDDIKTAGTTRRAANPSARPETGKTNNSSCGDAQTSSLTEKTGELSTTTKSGKLALQAADDSRYGSVQVSVSSDPTHAVNAESNNSGMNSTDARAEQEAYKNSGKRRRKPAPVEKRGKENASKKRKPNSSTVAVAARTSETSFSDMSSILNCTKRRKGLFNVRDNSLMVAVCAQKSFVNKTVSRGQSISGIPPRLNKFMENFIAPKLLRSKPQ